MKKLISVILCLLLAFGGASAVLADQNRFADVKPDSWYYDDVLNAVRLGIINGKSDTSFAPDDNLTYAEAIKLAACMHQLYADGSVYLVPIKTPWYQTYVDYCQSAGIISKEYNYTKNATRAGYMEIFAKALPDDALKAINNVPDGSIPDVPMYADYVNAIYKLYRAGILTGVDSAHRCEPSSTIKRCEVAAIITRMMDETKRIKFSMGETEEKPTTEQPKEENPKSEEEKPVLEIPKDAVTAPKVDENKFSEKVETPEMYEPFEIIENPVSVLAADENEELKYSVKVSGGKAPYTYEWVTRSWHNRVSPMEDGEYVKGTKTNTLSMIFNIDNPYSSPFYCKVTDALGQTVQSEFAELPEKLFIFSPETVTKYGDGYIFAGRISKGKLKVGETVAMSVPSENIQGYGVVTSIEMFKKRLDEAEEGNYCGILVEKFEEYPYDQFISESYSESMTDYIEGLNSYGVKIPLKVTSCHHTAYSIGDPYLIYPIVKGGTPPYTYEWYVRQGTQEYEAVSAGSKHKIDGEYLYITTEEKDYTNNVNYRCVITDAAGNKRTVDNWYLSSETTPYLYMQPQDVCANPGDEITFKVRTRTVNIPTYQWYVKYDGRNTWQKIEAVDSWASGETTNTLKILVEKTDLVNHCEYRCEVKHGDFEVVSQSAKVLPYDIVITEHPKNVSGKHADTVTFKVKAEGANGPFTYQWLIQTPDNEIPLQITEGFLWAGGQTTDTLSVAVDETKLTSEYTFSCIVTDAKGIKRVSEDAYVIVTSDANVSLEKGRTSKPEMIVITD